VRSRWRVSTKVLSAAPFCIRGCSQGWRMSTYEPCKPPSTKETPISLPMPRMRAHGQGAIESGDQRRPVRSLPLAQTHSRYRENPHGHWKRAIPRFHDYLAKPCSSPLIALHVSARSRTSFSRHTIFQGWRRSARARGAQRTHLPLAIDGVIWREPRFLCQMGTPPVAEAGALKEKASERRLNAARSQVSLPCRSANLPSL
jgi:hypothetical protein